jgi:hypothetical protein
MIFFDMDAPVAPNAVKAIGSSKIVMSARCNLRERLKMGGGFGGLLPRAVNCCPVGQISSILLDVAWLGGPDASKSRARELQFALAIQRDLGCPVP